MWATSRHAIARNTKNPCANGGIADRVEGMTQQPTQPPVASADDSGWTNPLRDPRDLRLPRIAGPCGVVIFGVTGDLSRKKLLPAIYDLANRGLLPPSFGLTGFARRDWTEDKRCPDGCGARSW